MAAFVYNRMCAHGIYDHVVDLVSKKVHRALFADALGEIRALYDPFERLFTDGDVTAAEPIHSIQKSYPDAKGFSDSSSNWITHILKLSSTKFVLFHVHTTNKMYEDFIAVGERKGTTLVMDRFSYANSSLYCNNIGKITEYFKVAKGDAKCMPFRCLTEAMAPGMDYCNMSFADSSDLPHIMFRSKGIMLRDSVSDMSLLKVADRIKFWFSMNNIFTLDPKPVKGTLGYNYPDSDESDEY